MKEWKTDSMEQGSIVWPVPEKKRGGARTKKVAVVESRWVTGNRRSYMCCPRTSTQNKNS